MAENNEKPSEESAEERAKWRALMAKSSRLYAEAEDHWEESIVRGVAAGKPPKVKRKIVYVDMDNVLVDFKSGIDRMDKDVLKQFEGRLDEVPGIFAKMDPMPGAIEAFKELADRFEVYVLSTAPWENPTAWSDKLLWVKKHLGRHAYKRLILSHNKHLNQGDYLIDDRTKNGVDQFEGEHIHFGTEKFPDWVAVMVYLRTRK